MTKRDFISLEKRLLPGLHGFSIAGQLMLLSPVGDTLRGVYFESHTSDAKLFYVWAFFFPLYIPTERIYFNLGKRISANNGDRWDADKPDVESLLTSAIQKEAVPFLANLKSADDVVDTAKRIIGDSKDPYGHQAIAFALARGGRIEQAVNALDRLNLLLDVNSPWQGVMAKRANTLKSLLTVPADANRQLDAWVEESIRNLELERFR